MRGWTAILGLTVLLLLTAPAAHAADPRTEVRQVFEDYRAALMERQGAIAAFLVTPETQAFYETARRAALDAGREAMDALPLAQALLALRLRHDLGAERLRSMAGEEIIAEAVERGIVRASGLRAMRLGPVAVGGDTAVAEQLDPAGRPLGVVWRFERIGGLWRVDLRPSLAAADALMQKMLRDSGLSRKVFLERLVTMSSERPVTEELWRPPGGSAAAEHRRRR